MRNYFAEVLARESASLAGVTDGAKLVSWRRRVVRELMTPHSPYALALRQTNDLPDRSDFLGRWGGLITETVDRVLQSCSYSGQSRRGQVDSQQTAVLILAALHGGSALSRVNRDPRALNAALDLALAPLVPSEANGANATGST